ncbi:NrfG protein, partial [Salmonella enterica]|nr:NrfG protein [Salmonella enterica]EIM8969744.1 hypothetical protein [Salmonella enterica]EKG6489825.1 hypothetical protein [Salmonella enterica]
MQVYKNKILHFLLCIVVLMFAGCATPLSGSADTPQKLELLRDSKNYRALIDIYRERLKKHENGDDRYALSYYYYSSGDCISALQYLSSVSAANMRNRILYIRSLIACEKYRDSITQTNAALKLEPRNYELLNLKGIAEALSGHTRSGKKSIQSARDLFIKDKTAINNLAMIEIIEGNYEQAVKILLPLYQNGCKDLTIVHNLVYSLVKSGYIVYAKSILEKEKLSEDVDS